MTSHTNALIRGLLVLCAVLPLPALAQSSCRYTVSPLSLNAAVGAQNLTVTVSTTSTCSWTATETADWLSITSGRSGLGNGTVAISVLANTTGQARSSRLTVAGQSVTVSQSGCSISFSPASAAAAADGDTGSISVSAAGGCPWAVRSSASWLDVTSGATGTGGGTVLYSVDRNPQNTSREATISGSGATFRLTQRGLDCSYRLDATTLTASVGGQDLTISISTSSNCSWTATESADWVSITSGRSGSGNGLVSLSVAPNTTGQARSTRLTVAGQTVTLNQPGCRVSFEPATATASAEGDSGFISVSAPDGCPWAARSSASWLDIASGASGTGGGSIRYSVEKNTSNSSRQGTISGSGATFQLTQRGMDCSYQVSPQSLAAAVAGENLSISVTTSSTCSWTASESADWASITSGRSGLGNGSVAVSVTPNTTGAARSARITVAGQTVNLTQSGCAVGFSPTADSASADGGTGTIAVAAPGGCPWAVRSSAGWLDITSGSNGLGSGSVQYSIDKNTSAASREATISGSGASFRLTQRGTECTFRVDPTALRAAVGGENLAVAVTTQTACSWTAAESASWLSITSGRSGLGSGTVAISVDPNTSGQARGARVTVAGQSVTVDQAGCAIAFNPAVDSAPADGGPGTISVSAPGECPWTVRSSANWLEITSGGSGIGSGTIGYAAERNVAAAEREATISGSGASFRLLQRGTECTYQVDPATLSAAAAGQNLSVSVSTGSNCAWNSSGGADWLSITAGRSGLGNGSVTMSAASNSTGQARTARVTVAGKPVTVDQSGCTITLTPASAEVPADASTGSISVGAADGCPWAVRSNASWLDITSGAGGTGGGTVTYSAERNTGVDSREGVVSGSGASFRLRQRGTECSYRVQPETLTAAVGGQNLTVSVTTAPNCAWNSSENADWLSITSGRSGLGDGTVVIAATSNALGQARSAKVTVAGQEVTVNQDGCGITLNPAAATAPLEGGTGSIAVSASSGCPWSVKSSAAWLSITSGSSGAGNGSVRYSAGRNPGNAEREATISGSGASFRLLQMGARCAYLVDPPTLNAAVAGQELTVAVTTASNCSWTAAESAAWASIVSGRSGTGSGTVRISVTPNTTGQTRGTTLTVAGNNVTVNQSGCPISFSPAADSAPAAGGTGSVSVSAASGCPWAVRSSAAWLRISSGATGTADGVVRFVVDTNGAVAEREAAISGSGESFRLLQHGTECTYRAEPPIVNASPGGQNLSVAVNTAPHCAWTSSSGVGWLSITSGRSGTGSGSAGISVTPNTTGEVRSAKITVAGQSVTVDQSGCTISFAATAEKAPAEGGEGAIPVSAPAGCPWAVKSSVSWLDIVSGGSGIGNGTLRYVLEPNSGALEREATISGSGADFKLLQGGGGCTHTLDPKTVTLAPGAQTFSVGVRSVAGCSWAATEDAPWLAISSGRSGSGNGSVTLAAATNVTGAERTAKLTVGRQTVAVSQSGCTVRFTPATANIPQAGSTGVISLSAAPDCPWTARSSALWVDIVSGSSGTGSGAIRYSIPRNGASMEREATITAPGELFLLVQQTERPSAASCQPITGTLNSTMEGALTPGDCPLETWIADQPPGRWARIYRLLVTRPGHLRAALHSGDFDAELFLLDSSRRLLASNDDAAEGSTDSMAQVSVEPGLYYLVVSSHESSRRGAFTVETALVAGRQLVYLFLPGMNSDAGAWDRLNRHAFNGRCVVLTSAAAIAGNPAIPQSDCYLFEFGAVRRNGKTWSNGDGSAYSELGAEVGAAVGFIRSRHGLDSLVITGHGRGGLAARAYLQGLSEHLPFRVALLTIGAPHLGSPLGRVYHWLSQRSRLGGEINCAQAEASPALRQLAEFLYSPSAGYLASSHDSDGVPVRDAYSDAIHSLNAGAHRLARSVDSFAEITSADFGLGQDLLPEVNLDALIGCLAPSGDEAASLRDFVFENLPSSWIYEGDGVAPIDSQRLRNVPGFDIGAEIPSWGLPAGAGHFHEPGQVAEIQSMLETLVSSLAAQPVAAQSASPPALSRARSAAPPDPAAGEASTPTARELVQSASDMTDPSRVPDLERLVRSLPGLDALRAARKCAAALSFRNEEVRRSLLAAIAARLAETRPRRR